MKKNGHTHSDEKFYSDQEHKLGYRDDFYGWNCNALQCRLYFNADEKTHRDNKPAIITYYENGNLQSEAWVRYDNYYRDDNLPAFIRYDDNGNISLSIWYKDGQVHCEDGPGRIIYNPDGTINNVEWRLRGISMSFLYYCLELNLSLAEQVALKLEYE